MAPELLSAIEASVAAATGTRFSARSVANASGGCIHRSFILSGPQGRCFAKTNEARFFDAFQAEADGLTALAEAGMRVPQPLGTGQAGAFAFLVLEYLELRPGGAREQESLGRALAAMHCHHGPCYGWRRDNFIGATPQRNRHHSDWAGFWREERLSPQLELARKNGHGALERSGKRLCERLEAILRGYSPEPSLVHGDLWNGNASFLADSTPVLFDPAVYYGDAEVDLAMTELFGGFPPRFYSAYREIRPLDAGYSARKDLYNLYHVLNHANLFGGGYAAQAKSMMERLLARR